MKSSTQSNIMRRVYYAWVLRISTHPVTLQLAALLVVAWSLKELVFVARVWEAFVTTPVGELGTFVYQLLTHADYPTVALTLVAVVLLTSVVSRLTVTAIPQSFKLS